MFGIAIAALVILKMAIISAIGFFEDGNIVIIPSKVAIDTKNKASISKFLKI